MKSELIGRGLVLLVLAIVIVVPIAIVFPRASSRDKGVEDSSGSAIDAEDLGTLGTTPSSLPMDDSRSPTVSPLPQPTSFPTAQPTTQQPSTLNPTKSPVNPTPLVVPVRGCSPENPCELCQGHCSDDSNCQGQLVCFKKEIGEPVPFCEGIDMSKTNWCTHQSIPPSAAPTATASSAPTPSSSMGSSSSLPTIAPSLPDGVSVALPTGIPTAPTSTLPTATPTGSPTSKPPTQFPTITPTRLPTTPEPTKSPDTGNRRVDPMYLAYYYPWYYKNDWSQHGYVDTPKLGLYGTDDPAVAEQHIEWAVRAGVDAFVTSWWKPDGVTTKHMASGLLSASNIGDIKFAINYETKGALPTENFADGTIALDTLIADMQYLEEQYFSHPSYCRVNNRPLVVLYITRTWDNFEPHMLDQVRASLKEDVLFLADEPYHGNQKWLDEAQNGIKDGRSVFEAYTTYNMFENFLIKEGESATDYMLREGLPIFERWSKETLFFPNVLPMYHDFRGHLPLWGDAAGLIKQLQVFTCLPRPSWFIEGSIPDMIFITSFNEWWEGSQIEPDKDDRYGFEFIDALKTFKESKWTCENKETD
mmetsp:Transcript_42245/g.62576  ORF Transcript_42245/g.62576 Transcript_42245/m.62576 type:complete len:587 (-) Transcript_42245:694-2454(-)|eukprot:CAMPEP_0194029224 /NCGR_PEP_ID=MMETSP0009_2-20130614/3016_1 /TAXON_ID=210454 /ORGANISM="Grammatophora oceanica, Strain CCMP 410" /LENGTH=586 /DNA_ID=CAMNT_0038668835 /DNA_START=21 /DNA_END=1781 /DNA_ORIENTATION=-